MKINAKDFIILPSEACAQFMLKIGVVDKDPNTQFLVQACFMAGASYLYDICVHGVTALSDNEAEKFMTLIAADLEQFQKKIL